MANTRATNTAATVNGHQILLLLLLLLAGNAT